MDMDQQRLGMKISVGVGGLVALVALVALADRVLVLEALAGRVSALVGLDMSPRRYDISARHLSESESVSITGAFTEAHGEHVIRVRGSLQAGPQACLESVYVGNSGTVLWLFRAAADVLRLRQ